MITVTQKGNIDAIFRLDEAVKELDLATDNMVEMAKAKAPIAKEAYYEWSREKGRKVKRRPGRLKRNIKKTERQKSFRVYIDMGTRGAPYGIFQELGFTHWKSGKTYAGHFFMEEALNATLAQLDAHTLELADKCLNLKGHNGKAVVKYR